MDTKWIALWVGFLLSPGLVVTPSHAAPANADVTPTSESASDGYWPRVIATLAGSDRLRDRALAAQLRMFQAPVVNRPADNPSASPIQPEQAAAIHLLLPDLARSDDPLALSLALQAGVSGSDKAVIDAASKRWHALESDNLAPILWIGQATEETLRAARVTTRYDSRSYEQIRFMMEVFQRVPMSRTELGAGHLEIDDTDEARAAVNAFAIWAAYGIPAFQEVVNACRDQGVPANAARITDCRHVAEVLAKESDVLIARGIGAGMLKRMATSEDEQARARALRRELDWQLQQRYANGGSGAALRDDIDTMLRLLRDPGIGTETQMSEAILRERGIALTPPADWPTPDTN